MYIFDGTVLSPGRGFILDGDGRVPFLLVRSVEQQSAIVIMIVNYLSDFS